MKYDSSMEKRFRDDIITTLKTAFCADTEIPTHKEDADPTALREYLKKNYGKSMQGGTVSGAPKVNLYRFAVSSGITIGFNDFLEGKDNDLILSWSQLTTFLRKNMDDIFPEMLDELYAVNEDGDTPSERPTYIDLILSQDMYKELTAEDFLRQNEYCPYDFIDDYGAPVIGEKDCIAEFYDSNEDKYIRKCESCRDCWNTICPDNTDFYNNGITAEKIRKRGEEYKAIVEELERENADSEDDEPFDKKPLEDLISNFDESTVKCPFWKSCETLHYHEFGCVDFECAHKKQVYDCDDVDKLSAQLEMCSGYYESCGKYAENAPYKTDIWSSISALKLSENTAKVLAKMSLNDRTSICTLNGYIRGFQKNEPEKLKEPVWIEVLKKLNELGLSEFPFVEFTSDIYDTSAPDVFDIKEKGKFKGVLIDIPIIADDEIRKRLADNGLSPKSEDETAVMFQTDKKDWNIFYIPDKYGGKTNMIRASAFLTDTETETMKSVTDTLPSSASESAINPPAVPEVTAVTPANSDYAAAALLNAEILACAKAAQENLYQMAMGFKKMHDDKMYKALGYNNFDDYCTNETPFSKMHVMRYITIAENLPEDFVTSGLQIGVKKLALLAAISEEQRTELTESTNLESTTVKELQEKIKELKQQAEDERKLKLKAQQGYDKVCREKFNETEKNKRLETRNSELETRVNDLEIENKNLENRTLTVAEIPEEEINRRARAQVQKILDDKDREWNERLTELKAEYGRRGRTDNIDEKLTEIFDLFYDKAKYAIRDCIDFIRNNSDTDEIKKSLTEKFRGFASALDIYYEDLDIGFNVVEKMKKADNDFTLED